MALDLIGLPRSPSTTAVDLAGIDGVATDRCEVEPTRGGVDVASDHDGTALERPSAYEP